MLVLNRQSSPSHTLLIMSLDIHFSGEPGDASFEYVHSAMTRAQPSLTDILSSLVAVHGFFNTSSEAWDLGSESEPWLKEQLTAKKRYGRLLFHRYDTGASAVQGLCGRDAIQKEAIMLLQKVAEQRKDQDPVSPSGPTRQHDIMTKPRVASTTYFSRPGLWGVNHQRGAVLDHFAACLLTSIF